MTKHEAGATDLAGVRKIARARSPLSPERTEEVISKRFGEVPNRLRFALEAWPLAGTSVLDVGCAYGHSLVHFGPGSMGIDNVEQHVDFCRALGLDARLIDVDRGIEDVPDGAFDYAWVSDIVEHLDAPRLLLRRLAPKLKPDGRLLLYVTTLPRNRLARVAWRRLGVTAFDAGTHHYQFTSETAAFLLQRAGYAVRQVAVPFFRGRLAPLSPAVRHSAPTLILEAVVDSAAQDLARDAEEKNKPG